MLVPKVAAPVLPNTNFAGRPAVPEAPFEINDIEESFIAVPSTCKAAVTPPTVLEAPPPIKTDEPSNALNVFAVILKSSAPATLISIWSSVSAVILVSPSASNINYFPLISM